MPSFIDQLKRYGGIFSKGLLVEVVPGMAAGAINVLFHEWNVDLERITKDIQYNRSLWTGLDEEHKQQLAHTAKQIGSLDFITSEFFINAIKKDFPAVASLLLNSKMAGEWLERQINELKGGVAGINIDKKDNGN